MLLLVRALIRSCIGTRVAFSVSWKRKHHTKIHACVFALVPCAAMCTVCAQHSMHIHRLRFHTARTNFGRV